jgi:glycosyltransferase involved in cell wall biosynthesis
VKVINVLIDNKQPVLRRMITFLQYAIISSWFAVTLKADVVIASSGPITVGIPGLIAKWFRRRKLVFEARDLWPEGAVRMGLLKNRAAVSMAYWFEKLCYKNSYAVVGLSPGIQNDIQKRFPRVRVESVTNAANISLFSSRRDNDLSVELKNYAIYFGNIGQVNHSGYLVDAAKVLVNKGRADIRILLIGDGQLKNELVRRIESEGIENVVVMALMPKSQLVSYIQNSIASVVPLRPIPVFDTSSPNKLFESMAAGVPVIQTTQGWIKDFLKEHGGGFTVDGNSPEELADLLILLKDDRALRVSTGQQGAAIAKRYFDKDYLASKMLSVLQEIHDAR